MLTAAAITVIPFTTNLTTIANAQEQQQPTRQPAAIDNATTAQSAKDSFRVQVPQGWIIHDVDNTGFTLISEVMQGYGILAQLCPEEQQQQQQLPSPNVVDPKAITCQEAGEEIIHIIRYPNLGAILEFTLDDIINDFDDTADTILSYQMQKLRGVGYSDIRIVNNTDTEIPVDLNSSGMNNNDDNELPAASVRAKLVEITYRTSSAPSEIKTGYFLLTATNATPQDLGTISGYGIFYEGVSSAATTPPAPVNQVFSSFELIATPEIVETLLAALAAQEELAQQSELVEQTEQTTQTEEVVGEPISPLTGELIANDTEGVAPATFEFEADMTGGLEPYTINWDFGDG
ncbi:MAG: hypothetical protein ACREAS_04660, partial [Nitrososphaera sp.]